MYLNFVTEKETPKLIIHKAKFKTNLTRIQLDYREYNS